VVEADALDAEIDALVADLLRATPLGLRMTKEALDHAIDMASLDAVLALEDRNQILGVQGEDFGEGVRAFLEKRAPRYGQG
jgi:enoyl-CoA hydratase/carnithine racemase